MTAEEAFIQMIDCNFDYDNYKTLVDQARDISSKCVEMVVYEIIKPPRSVELARNRQWKMLDYINTPESSVGKQILKGESVPAVVRARFKILF